MSLHSSEERQRIINAKEGEVLIKKNKEVREKTAARLDRQAEEGRPLCGDISAKTGRREQAAQTQGQEQHGQGECPVQRP